MLSGVDAALAAAARGLALFALPPAGRRPEPGWHHRCTTDPDTVRRMWTAGNVGVGCRVSDVVGVDLDRHAGADGVAAFAAACAKHGHDWPDTFTVATAHGGLHLYFRASGRPIRSTSGGRSGLGPGIDTRGPGRWRGGYLIAPGSVVDGLPYTVERNVDVQELPGWLAEILDGPGPGRPTRPTSLPGAA